MKSKPKASRKSRTAGELNPRQRLFVQEYLVDQDGQAAAIRAGYAHSRAKITASQLLADPRIAAAIAEGVREREARAEITADRILYRLDVVADANMLDFLSVETEGPNKGQIRVDPMKASREQWRAVKEFIQEDIPGRGRRTRIKLHDQTRANELLGKNTGLFVNRTQVEHTGKVEIENAARELESAILQASASAPAGSNSRRLN
jgi:phage terminase small subunit